MCLENSSARDQHQSESNVLDDLVGKGEENVDDSSNNNSSNDHESNPNNNEVASYDHNY